MKKLLFIAALIGLIAAIAKKAKIDRVKWSAMTEDDVRDQLDQRLPNQIPDERRQVITDTIVTKMRDRGVIQEDADSTIDLADDGLDVDAVDQIEEPTSA